MEKKDKCQRWLTGLLISAVFGIPVLVTGCYEVAPEWVPLEPTAISHNILQFSDEGDFAVYAREAAIQQMRAQVELSRNQSIEYLQYDDRSGPNFAEDVTGMPTADADADADADSGTSDGQEDYSTTNTQEAGVGEADITVTDGDYIYSLSSGELVIVAAGVDGALEKISTVLLGGYANEMFVLGDTAVVFSTVPETDVPETIHYRNRESVDAGYYPGGEMDADVAMPCEGDGCGWYGPGYAQIAVIDISDRAAPSVIRTTVYAAQYVTARRIGDSVRVVLYSPLPILDTAWVYDDGTWNTEDDVNRAYSAMVQSNIDYFSGLSVEEILPGRIDSSDNLAVPIVNPSEIMAPETPNGFGLQTIVSVSIENPMQEMKHSAVFSQQGIVYASQESLYLTSARDYVTLAMESGLWGESSNETTGIHRFDISDPARAAKHVASGEVSGRLLDQFCMGEWNGDLRVASTTGNAWENPGSLDNRVTVLRENSGRLIEVGKLTGLGAGEELYAARFIGDKGFLVTFLQTDPLFTLDLSDPAHPRSVGEWLGPGYSTYLHPWGEDKLIAVGEEDWQVTLSLYNLVDFSQPTLTERFSFEQNEYSAAVSDHKAFTFNPQSGYLALPFSSWNDSFQTGVRTFSLSEEGIEEGDALNFFVASQMNSELEASRSLFIGDYMFGMSRCRLVSAPADSPATPAASLPLFSTPVCEDWGSVAAW